MSTVALPVLHPGMSITLAELISPCSCLVVLYITNTVKARGGLTQRGFTCTVDSSLRKSQLESGQLCAAAAQSTSSWLAASAREMPQGQLQMSCWVSLCHPHPAESRLSKHQEHLCSGKARSPQLRGERCSAAGSWGHIPGAGEGKMGRAGSPRRNEPSLGSCHLARLLQTKWR